MAYQPGVDQELSIGSVMYHIAEHPAAPGMPYGQEGRQAVVYQVVAESGEKRALKTFKPRFRVPALVSLAERMAAYAELPGLQVCKRTVLSATKHIALLREYPDLTYAVLMPWVEGPTWMEAMMSGPLAPEQSLTLARSLAQVLARMEEKGLAHCDLSGPNVLLPILVGGEDVALVDVEQMYRADLTRPPLLPSGSPGYAHKSAPDGIWSMEADRFTGSVLLAEMLAWCDERARNAAWGETYFTPDEMQKDCERMGILETVLRERWGGGVGNLFERAWRSDLLTDCPTFGEWLVGLPEEVPVPLEARDSTGVSHEPELAVATDAIQVLMDVAQRLEEQENLSGARVAFEDAVRLAGPASGLGQELTLVLERLNRELSVLPGGVQADTTSESVSESPVATTAEGNTAVRPAQLPAAEMAGLLARMRAAISRRLGIAPRTSKAQALPRRFEEEALLSVGSSGGLPEDNTEHGDERLSRAVPLWHSLPWITLGWAIGWAPGWASASGFGTLIGFAAFQGVCWAVGGAATAFCLRREKVLGSWKWLVWMALGCFAGGAVGGAIGWMVAWPVLLTVGKVVSQAWIFPAVIYAINGAVGGAICGFVTGCALLREKALWSWKWVLWVGLGWSCGGVLAGGLGGALGGALVDTAFRAVGWVVVWAIGGAVFGAIGGAILIRSLRWVHR